MDKFQTASRLGGSSSTLLPADPFPSSVTEQQYTSIASTTASSSNIADKLDCLSQFTNATPASDKILTSYYPSTCSSLSRLNVPESFAPVRFSLSPAPMLGALASSELSDINPRSSPIHSVDPSNKASTVSTVTATTMKPPSPYFAAKAQRRRFRTRSTAYPPPERPHASIIRNYAFPLDSTSPKMEVRENDARSDVILFQEKEEKEKGEEEEGEEEEEEEGGQVKEQFMQNSSPKAALE